MEIISMKGLVEKAHGKICQNDNNSVSYRKKDGKMFSSRRCNPRDLSSKPYTAKELQVQSSFTAKSKAASAWTKANRVYKPGSRVIDLAASTEDYRKMRAAFDDQDKIPSFQAFVWAQVVDGTVVVPDIDTDTNTGTNTGTDADPGNDTPAPTPTYTLSVASDDESQGKVNTEVNKSYSAGARVTITATPEEGYDFDRWSDNNGGASRIVTMNSDLNLTAYFKEHTDEDAGGGGMFG